MKITIKGYLIKPISSYVMWYLTLELYFFSIGLEPYEPDFAASNALMVFTVVFIFCAVSGMIRNIFTGDKDNITINL